MITNYIYLGLAVLALLSSIMTVQQGSVAIITMFGKYRRILYPGFNFRIPFLEVVYRKVSIQNRSIELDFQAITQDQANVYFKAMLLYSVFDNREETLKNVAFKFVNDRDFMTALIRTIEGSIRGFVATKRQAEILALRKEIVESVKEGIDAVLESWTHLRLRRDGVPDAAAAVHGGARAFHLPLFQRDQGQCACGDDPRLRRVTIDRRPRLGLSGGRGWGPPAVCRPLAVVKPPLVPIR